MQLGDVGLNDLHGALGAVMVVRTIYIDLQAAISWLQAVVRARLAVVRLQGLVDLRTLNKRFPSH